MKESNQLHQDTWTTSILREVPTPTVATGEAEAFLRDLRHVKPRIRWAAPSGLIATAGLIGALIFIHPTPSAAAPTLNQVDLAQSSVKYMTVTYRLLSAGSEIYVVKEARKDNKWSVKAGESTARTYSNTIMDGNRTVYAFHRGKRFDVEIDGPSQQPVRTWQLPTPENFLSAPSELFRPGKGGVKVTKGFDWNGKIVDKFECVEQVRQGHFVRHTLYAEPQSHLPLQLEIVPLDKTPFIGETFSYDYSQVPDSTFELHLPTGAKVVDMRAERLAVYSALKSNGLVIVDDRYSSGVFLPDRPDIRAAAKANKIRVRIDGGPQSNTYPQEVMVATNGNPGPAAPWRQEVVYVQPPVANLQKLRKQKSAVITVNGKQFKVPVIRIASIPLEFQYPGHRM